MSGNPYVMGQAQPRKLHSVIVCFAEVLPLLPCCDCTSVPQRWHRCPAWLSGAGKTIRCWSDRCRRCRRGGRRCRRSGATWPSSASLASTPWSTWRRRGVSCLHRQRSTFKLSSPSVTVLHTRDAVWFGVHLSIVAREDLRKTAVFGQPMIGMLPSASVRPQLH